MSADDIAHALGGARRVGRGWRCRCPLHQGRGEWFAVGEGTETTLSGAAACAMPGWAARSAGGFRSQVLSREVTHVIICADHYASGVGERAARDAAARWLAEGRRVKLPLPPRAGIDFNDVLRGVASAPTEEARRVAD